MTTTIWTAACATILSFASATLIAQAASQTPRSTTDDRRVIVTGCLTEASSTSSDAATGPTELTDESRAARVVGAGAAAPTFLVTVASVSPAAASSDENTKTGAGTGTSAARTYQVIGNAELLQGHVGERVEVTGTFQEKETAAGVTTAGSSGKVPIVRLESGKTIAASCGVGAH